MNNQTILNGITSNWQNAIKHNDLFHWSVLYEYIEAINNSKGHDVETYLMLDFLQTIAFQLYSDMHKEATTKGVRH